ncbi:hypothetical protein [Paraburkholderia sp. SUR17]|uniref:hypothetical protein n=1 Tax=Paraburkholderia sp. SUR17 TaxID=3034358 RepID=UPI0024085CD0|nr:hypothetical protein [Paraburkholderia sp. SUR17]WEY37747.1 hypothetical protein P2869_11730 [Paraburkholderia sp. SUR17]
MLDGYYLVLPAVEREMLRSVGLERVRNWDCSRADPNDDSGLPSHCRGLFWGSATERGWTEGTLAFTCELGPRPYAIIDRAGNDTTDRWAESLLLQGMIRKVWEDVQRDVRPTDHAYHEQQALQQRSAV